MPKRVSEFLSINIPHKFLKTLEQTSFSYNHSLCNLFMLREITNITKYFIILLKIKKKPLHYLNQIIYGPPELKISIL